MYWWMFHFTLEKGKILLGSVYCSVKILQIKSHARVLSVVMTPGLEMESIGRLSCPPQQSDAFDHGYSQDVAALEHWIRHIWRISWGFSYSFVLKVSDASNIDDGTAWIEVNSLVRYLQDCTEISLRRISFCPAVILMRPDAIELAILASCRFDSFIF